MGTASGPTSPRPSRPTIYDIARVAQVSPSTVSRALHRPGRVSAQTRDLIERTAGQLGYRANPMAQALHTGRTGTLALMVSDLTNPAWFTLIRGAQRAVRERGGTLVVAESQESPSHERQSLERLASTCDGLIIAGSRMDDSDLLDLNSRTSVVLVNREIDGVPSLVPDVHTGVAAALSHVVAQGHRSLTYLGGPSRSWIDQRRWHEINTCARALGMAAARTEGSDPTLAGGERAFDSIATTESTLVMAYNDLMAIGLMRAAHAANVDVPRALSIIGFDDIYGADLTSPGLTTIQTPLEELGARAVDVLAGSPERDVTPPATTLVIRGSTAVPPPH